MKTKEKVAQAQRLTKKIIARAQRHIFPATTQTKKNASPTGNSESPTPTKSCASTTGNKTINRASSTKHFTSHRPSNKTMKAQQETPKAQLQQKAAQARREIK
jgi:hypothetical protein